MVFVLQRGHRGNHKGSRKLQICSRKQLYGWQSLYDFPKPATAETYIRNYIQSETVQGATNYRYTQEDYEKWQQGTEKGYQPFDWYDYIWEVSPQTYVNANVSGGSDKINYYLSVGNLNQDAIIVNYGGFTRTNVQMNLNANISDKRRSAVE